MLYHHTTTLYQFWLIFLAVEVKLAAPGTPINPFLQLENNLFLNGISFLFIQFYKYLTPTHKIFDQN
jgi:hypothetical protein